MRGKPHPRSPQAFSPFNLDSRKSRCQKACRAESQRLGRRTPGGGGWEQVCFSRMSPNTVYAEVSKRRLTPPSRHGGPSGSSDSSDLLGAGRKGQRQRDHRALRGGSGFAPSPSPPLRGAGPPPSLGNPDLHEGAAALEGKRGQVRFGRSPLRAFQAKRTWPLFPSKASDPGGQPWVASGHPSIRPLTTLGTSASRSSLTIPGPRADPCGHPRPKPHRPWARWFAPSEGCWLERSKCNVPTTFLAMTSPRSGLSLLPHPGTFRPFQPLQSQRCNQRDEGRRGWRNCRACILARRLRPPWPAARQPPYESAEL